MERFDLSMAIQLLIAAAQQPGRNLQMSGDPQYQPKDLQPYLGYDQRVGWQIIAEWAWMHILVQQGLFPEGVAKFLATETLAKLLQEITTTKVTELERRPEVGHDIIALLMLMREYLPPELHPVLHDCSTSYDPISTAFALQAKATFKDVFYPKAKSIDKIWRECIRENSRIIQVGRTHLQDGLPTTVGAWLAVLHCRFVKNVRRSAGAAAEIHGKWSGAIGRKNALKVFSRDYSLYEEAMMRTLGLPAPDLATQLPLPEGMERFYHEIVLVSASLANLGEDVRHLQASAIREVKTESSTSSAMSHKDSNPIAAENLAGMHVSVRAEFMKVLETMNSDLFRDLRYSNVMRGYSAVLVFAYQQLLTAHRLFKNFKVDKAQCLANFSRSGNLMVAELLHLYLQRKGYPGAHELVNKTIVPLARGSGNNLAKEMDIFVKVSQDEDLKQIWGGAPNQLLYHLCHPEEYIGDSIMIAEIELTNMLLG
jgi:adenylosuccinate lyase